MSELLDRMAKAMCRADAERRGNRYATPEYGANLHRFKVMARAALVCLREPCPLTEPWQAMIDRALDVPR